MNKISLLLFLFSNIVFATIPKQFEDHINDNLTLLNTIQYKKYTKPQKDLIIDNFIDGMAEKYQIKDFNLTEVQNLIYSKIKTQKKENYLPVVNPDYLNFLKDLIKDSNLEFHENILTISYQGLDIPFFAKSDFGINRLSLDGIFQDSCLSLSFENKAMTIGYLGSALKACPIPRGPGSGTFLLKLAEEVAKKLKMQKISLSDKSKVKCSKNNKEVSLKLLKYFQKGKSWYGSHGYLPEHKNLVEYEKEIEELRNYPISSIEKLFNTIAMSDLEQIKNEEKSNTTTSYQKSIIDKYYDKFFSLKEEFDKQVTNYKIQNSIDKEEVTLATFFSWLWNEDCESYGKLIDLIFPGHEITKVDLREELIPKTKIYYKSIH